VLGSEKEEEEEEDEQTAACVVLVLETLLQRDPRTQSRTLSCHRMTPWGLKRDLPLPLSRRFGRTAAQSAS
jgi:hypothetical protein